MSDQNPCSAYDTWAWLYNQTMGPDYSQSQFKFLQRTLLPGLPARAHILDLCCGTGQLIQPFIAAGYQVTGLDGSEAMLHYARQNAPQGTYLLGDARTFPLPAAAFAAVFSTSASLNHMMSLDDLAHVLRNVYQALKPGGVFLFDLNHPAQMQKWWRGRVVEGDVGPDYAWRLIPRYDTATAQGAFHVSIFQAPARSAIHRRFLQPFKQGLYGVLRRRRFIGLRLRVLAHFAGLEPDWPRADLTYPIKGHRLEAVQAALQQVGFMHVTVSTMAGKAPVDENHAAHFICRKPAVAPVHPEATSAAMQVQIF